MSDKQTYLPASQCQLRALFQGRGKGMGLMGQVLVCAMMVLIAGVCSVEAAPPGTLITSTAQVTYALGSHGGLTVSSNTVAHTTVTLRTRSSVALMQYASGVASRSQRPPAGAVNPNDLTPATIFQSGDIIFVLVADADQNIDPHLEDRVQVIISANTPQDQEQLVLSETGPDTGRFIGYVSSAAYIPGSGGATSGDAILTVTHACQIQCEYEDAADPADRSTSLALVDPYGLVFDSATGQPVDGAAITLINNQTGQPATVFGDDGASIFPATVISGATVTDSGGQVYTLPAGSYRFPFVAPGTYQLVVIPPGGYAVPSTVATTALQGLPNAPFVIAEPGSRGESFILNPGPAFRADIPMDPQTDSFWLTKHASTSQASAGDFVQYALEIENLTDGVLTGVTLSDQLPTGFRYQSQSIRIDDLPAAAPVISTDGRVLRLSLADMAPGARTRIRYVTAVGAGVPAGKAINTASVQSVGGHRSNVAQASVQVTDSLMGNTSFIVGRVAVRQPSPSSNINDTGVAGARVYLEDGTYVVTDKQGRFHFEGVTPGLHVVQLDQASLPARYVLQAVENNTRTAGRAFSQFVDLAPGTLWRTDFYVALKPAVKGHAQIELASVIDDNTISYDAHLRADDVPLRNQRLTVMLPPGAQYIKESSRINDVAIPDPRITGDVLTYDFSHAKGAWESKVQFRARVAQCPAGELVTQAVLSFDTPTKKRQSTPVVKNVALHTIEEQRLSEDKIDIQLRPDALMVPGRENLLIAVSKQSLVQHPTIVLNPRFEVFSSELQPNDKADIRQLAKQVKGLAIEKIVVTGHSDDRLIKPERRKIYIDNHRLSLARAQSVADYLAQTLNLPADNIHVLGKGPDEPVADNNTAIGRALNRRVTVQIHSRKLLRKNSMQQIPPLMQPVDASIALSPSEISILEELSQALARARVVHIQLAYLLKPNTSTTQLSNTAPKVRELPMARAQQMGDYLVSTLGLKDHQISLVGKSAEERASEALSDKDRLWDYRVDIRVHTEQVRQLDHLQGIKPHDTGRAETTGLYPGQIWKEEEAETPSKPAIQTFDKQWLERAPRGVQWLAPAAGTIPALPSTKIAIAHPADGQPSLIHNGQPVNPFNFEGTEMDTSRTKAISRWSGVDLVPGDNHFELTFKDKQGKLHPPVIHRIYYPGPPVAAELMVEQSQLIADGEHAPVVAIRLTDRSGQPVRPGVTGEFTVLPPYTAQATADHQKQQPLTMAGPPKAQFVVQKDGIALIHLQPTTESGEVELNLHLVDGYQAIRFWLQPQLRDWILVGLAEGTAGYQTLSGNMENLTAAGQEDDLYEDGRIAFFAKGQIKGAWLLTLAYDSAKDRKAEQSRLFQTIDPDAYYTLYGDDTQQGYEASSIRKLYVKLERNAFYALFGDYDTGLTVTELARYSRRLNGIKSELQHKHYNYNVFASETDQAFVKDEIRGDGTSGIYTLSRSGIAINSEQVRIQTRDRFRSETITDSQTLYRHVDYNIDYDAGTLFFKFPVQSRDADLNPIYIIVDYETNGSNDQAYTYGGRAAAKVLNQRVEMGASYIHEGPENNTGDLVGVDATVQLGFGAVLKAELATSKMDTSGSQSEGQAFLAEISRSTENLEANAYFREQEEGFGLGQQNGSETATRKLGFDIGYRINDHWRFDGQMMRQFNLATDAERDLDEAAVAYIQDHYSLRTGLRINEDRMGDGTTRRSELITTGGTYRCLDQRLQLRLDHEQVLGSAVDGSDFPTRTTLGADYAINRAVTLSGTHEYLWGNQEGAQNTRLGLKATPWHGGRVSTDLQQNRSENGERLLANLGLYQTWQLTPRWRIDGGLDRAETIDDSTQGSFNTNVPSTASADEAFTAISLGVGYDADKWSWTSRIETRRAETSKKWHLRTGIMGEPRLGLGLAAGLTLSQTDGDITGQKSDADLRLSLAIRPDHSAWTVLDRLDYIQHSDDANGSEGWRLVNNFNANYKPDHHFQIAMHYGAKYVMDTIDQQNYSGYVDLIGLEARHDLTAKWDVGLRGSMLHAWETGQMDYSCGLSVGHTLAKNTWISAGYNFMGFDDEDFSRANHTAQGPFVQFRIKFDQQTVREILNQWK